MAAAPHAPQDATVLVGARRRSAALADDDGRSAGDVADERRRTLETGKGVIRTKAEFTDFQLHVEFATPKE